MSLKVAGCVDLSVDGKKEKKDRSLGVLESSDLRYLKINIVGPVTYNLSWGL